MNSKSLQFLNTLGLRIRRWRTNRGLSITEAADICAISRGVFSKIERGENASMDSYMKVLQFIGVKITVNVPVPGEPFPPIIAYIQETGYE